MKQYRPGLAYPWHDEHGSVVLYHQRVSVQENGIEVSKVMPWWVPSADPDDNVRDFDSNALVLVALGSGGMPEPYKGLIYRLGEVLAAVRSGGGEVWLGEGESDAETLRERGYVATTGWGGAGKWSPAQAAWFRGYTGTVIVAVDNDPIGAKEGVLKFRSLTALGVDVRLAAPPDDFKESVRLGGGWRGSRGHRRSRGCGPSAPIGASERVGPAVVPAGRSGRRHPPPPRASSRPPGGCG